MAFVSVQKPGDVPCTRLEGRTDRPRGLGDLVAKATSAVGIKPCSGCKKRQEWLNKAVPFREEKQ